MSELQVQRITPLLREWPGVISSLPAARPKRLLILARHGRSEMNESRTHVQGRGLWVPLSKNGRSDAGALGRGLRSIVSRRRLVVTEAITSQAWRAKDTAALALKACGIAPPILEDAALNEINKGWLEGMLLSEAYPQEVEAAIQADPWHFRYGGAETLADAAGRWDDWLRTMYDHPIPEVSPADATPATLVVGHNVVTASGIARALMDEPTMECMQSYRIPNAAAFVLAQYDEGWILEPTRLLPG